MGQKRRINQDDALKRAAHQADGFQKRLAQQHALLTRSTQVISVLCATLNEIRNGQTDDPKKKAEEVLIEVGWIEKVGAVDDDKEGTDV